MKGAIALCLKSLVAEKYGQNKWNETLKNAGVETEPLMTLLSDLDDAMVLKLVQSACKVLNRTSQQISDEFGEFWMQNYVPKYYQRYMSGIKSAREMLLAMDSVHVKVTTNMQNSRPPRFEYKWVNDKTLVMIYKSNRNLMDLFIGLVKAVGKYFNERLQVKKINSKEVEIVFAQ